MAKSKPTVEKLENGYMVHYDDPEVGSIGIIPFDVAKTEDDAIKEAERMDAERKKSMEG